MKSCYQIVNSTEIHTKFFLKITVTIFIAFCLLSSLGCASKVSLKKEDMQVNRTVNISQNVSLPEAMFYQGRKEMMLQGTLGLIGAAAAEGGRKGTADIIKDVMNKSNVDVAQIVRTEFEQQLKSSNLFNTILPDRGNYPEIKLKIQLYGFASPQTFSSQLRPMLGITGELVKPDGSVIWKNYEYVSNLNGKTPSYTLEEYLKNPELIREAFNGASQIAVRGLIEDMKGE